MNYILQLELKTTIMAVHIAEITDYLNSSKFDWPDDHVNVNDLRLRLKELQNALNEPERSLRLCPNYDCDDHGKGVAWHTCGKCGTDTVLADDVLSDPV
jgi:hypothetical protein